MSWSISVAAVPRDGFGAATSSAVEDWREQNPSQCTEETLEQQASAAAAALAIVESGCVGDGWVSASLNGHSNPGHEVAEGSNSARDTTGVYVNRVAAPAPQEETAPA